MGTDISWVFQRKTDQKWDDIPSPYEGRRHYQLFAVLADVRNGTGVAGIKTGDTVAPIAPPRGLPDDFEVDNAGEHRGVFMGEHTWSWLTGGEILAWAETAPTVTHYTTSGTRSVSLSIESGRGGRLGRGRLHKPVFRPKSGKARKRPNDG